MASVEQLREAIAQVFQEWRDWPGPQAKFEIVWAMDTNADRYLLLDIGWDGYKRIHGLLAHLEIRDGKIWIQDDSTEEGIATDLLAKGVPKDQIVLGFQHPERRQFSEFAMA
jgi:hypothetical protein